MYECTPKFPEIFRLPRDITAVDSERNDATYEASWVTDGGDTTVVEFKLISRNMTDTFNKATQSLIDRFKQSINDWLLAEDEPGESRKLLEWFKEARKQVKNNEEDTESQDQQEADGDETMQQTIALLKQQKGAGSS